jgi:hypothetical protein
MAESGLFIGWGSVRTGREVAATKVFAEALAYWPRLQAAGEIESFETVLLGLHGGDLGAFFLLRGDPEGLGRLSMAPEFVRLMQRAEVVIEGLGVVPADLDAGVIRRVGDSNKATADLI